jgi:hypothetical protein
VIKFQIFVKLMQMTTSDSDAEALVAIRKANAMLKAERKNWEDLITGLVPMTKEAEARPQRRNYEDPLQHEYPSSESINTAFEEAFNRVNRASSFYATIESIHTWWEEKGFLTEKQLSVILKAAGRI